jgi:CheY-like chemotaxis protein
MEPEDQQIDFDNVSVTKEEARIDPDVEPGNFVRLSVSDTGHRMEPRIMERIFDPYFTTKEPGKGTEFGLSVVHGIVKSHGGKLKVYSEAGKGTVFHVFLPRSDGVEKVQPEYAQPLPRGSERLLFVDDEKTLADMGKEMLALLGYQVESRTSPVEALEAFRANPEKFDAVIRDMTMPNLTGVNLPRKLLEIRPKIPIILCNGFSDQANEERARAAGVRAFLFKPVALQDFAAAVRKVLDES